MYVTFSPEQVYSPEESLAHWLIHEALSETAGKESSQKSAAADAKKSQDNNAKKRKAALRPCHQMPRCVRRAGNNRALPTTNSIEQRTPLHVEEKTPEAAKMSLDVTGFSPKDIKLSVDNCVVSISGERTNKLGDVFVLDRKFRLDKKTAVAEKVTANFQDGILQVTIPKKSLAGPRTIPIALSAASVASTDETNKGASDKENAKENATEKTAAPGAAEHDHEADGSQKNEEEDKIESHKETENKSK